MCLAASPVQSTPLLRSVWPSPGSERDEDWQRPLRTEMDGLVKDTSSALQHLAQAFLPGERAGD